MNVWLFNNSAGRYYEVTFDCLRGVIDDFVVVAWDRDMSDVTLSPNEDGRHLRFNKKEFGDDVWRAFTGKLGTQIARWDSLERRWIKEPMKW